MRNIIADPKEARSLRRNYIELLVPAGTPEAFLAAVENGADAVYLGGTAFNARAGAGNFDDTAMQQALDYAHKRGVKIFVTMNILLADDELEEAMKEVSFLYKAGADALIIQDLGFGKLVRERYPDFPIHLSTQATVSDVASAVAAECLGYERIVLSRELSLAEIRAVREALREETEIEVFVHGALCICYSGQCQLSRYYGGRSGNRGRCAQPCRLPYTVYTEEGKRDRKQPPHPLSPRDLSYLDHLGELIEAGVTSFKIEGRMKSPEYVAVVTGIYRRAMDRYLATGDAGVTEEEREALAQIFNRGGFTDDYLEGKSGKHLMSGDIPKNRGLEIGRVLRHVRGGQVEIEAVEAPEIGDGAEIRRPDGSLVSTTISYVRGEGPIYRIGDFKEQVPPGSKLYRTSKKTQIKEAQATYRSVSLEDGEEGRKPHRRRPIKITLRSRGGMLSLTAETVRTPACPQPVRVTVQAGPFPKAEGEGTPRSRYETALGKLGSVPFELAEFRMEGENDLHVRMADLNALRREAAAALEEALVQAGRREACEPRMNAEEVKRSFEAYLPEDAFEFYFHDLAAYEAFRSSEGGQAVLNGEVEELHAVTLLLPLAGLLLLDKEVREALLRDGERDGIRILPYTTNVLRGEEEEILKNHRAEAEALAKRYGLSVSTLGALTSAAAAGIRVIADYGLNAVNRKTAEALMLLGASEVREGLERAEKEQGDIPLMVTEHRFPERIYRAKTGQRIIAQNEEYRSQSLILAEREKGDILDAVRACKISGKCRLYLAK